MFKLSFIVILFTSLVFAQSPHGADFNIECSVCHQSDTWKITTTSAFDHNTTKFKLAGKHVDTGCKQCHTSLQFTGTKTACADCHRDVHKGSVSNDCAKCHTPTNWLIPQIQSLHQSTRFPLQGRHSQAACNACHNEYQTLNFSVVSTRCYDCHTSDYQSATNPNHATAGFDKNCESCHSVNASSWRAQNFNHTFFPLTGMHAIENCYKCHNSTSFSGLSNQCYSCHESAYRTSANPNHVQQNFSTQCQNCHTINGWRPATFDHNATQFPLTGAHVNTNCSNCHTTGAPKPSTDCFSCHESKYRATTSPNHVQQSFSTACKTCHTTTAWQPATFDHNTTNFPLTGAHINTNCNSCHTTGSTKPSVDCYSCHTAKYNATTNPNHSSAGFNTQCATCHTTTAWKPATFDHDGPFFPIYSGKHRNEWNDCKDCHTTGNYQTFSCIDCHEHPKAKMDSEHQGINGYSYQSSACFNCHPRGSENGAVNHQTSSFPLTGSHTTTNCEQCHTTGFTTKLSTDCKTCHTTQNIPQSAPNHTLAGFSTNCTDCHSTNNFTQTTFSHQTATAFPLVGKHQQATCKSCHTTTYTATSKVCAECHQADLANSTDVNHSLAGFTQPCSQCHTETGWMPVTYTHPTQFGLTGKHATAECKSCHATQYANTANTCISCHQTDYNQTANPPHNAAGFNNQCQDCHNTTDWNQSSYAHDPSFPVYSGKHLNTWQKCTDCHTGNNYQAYSCVGCHDHNQTTTNQQHIGISGYVYNSTECKACHPTGVKTGSFNHALSTFPLTGAHMAAACNTCHTNGYAQKPPSDCKTCHQADLATVTNPKHSLGNFSQNCTDCHNTSVWKPSLFNHTTGTSFPLQGAHIPATCNSCHVTQYATTTKVCKECHLDDFQLTTTINHTLAGFTQTCDQCHTSSAWKPSSYNHSTTGYQLAGKHITTNCNKCHQTQYANTSSVCYDCHTAAYNATTLPNHSVSNISTDCKVCHTPNNWTTTLAYTAHDAAYFPVYSGEHRNEWNECTECHTVATNYSTFSCINCHEHNQTSMNSEHRNVQGYVYQSAECFNCHPRGSSANAFNHATATFPLSGSHLAISCQSCHATTYAGTPTDCYTCHTQDYTGSQSPSHTAVGIAQACSTCHNTTAWTPSSFSHTATTFPLTGVHVTTACGSCHNGNTTGTDKLCKACHTTDFQNTTNPSHSTLALSMECQTCHSTNADWKPATFPAHANYWAFQGAHVAIKDDCARCHNNNYTVKHTCYSCHQTKFTTAVNPPHVQYNFSQVCSTCHSQTAWTPATFNHSFYPISNKHRNVTCNQCHSQQAYAPQCLSCHQEDYIDGHYGTGHANCFECHDTNNFDDKKIKKGMLRE